MDYLTNFYKNKAQILSEQVARLEAQLAALQEDAPASTFSGTGQGQQTFSDEQLRDQMRQHKRTGLFGAQVDDDKQDQEYRDASAELNRRSSAASAKAAPQKSAPAAPAASAATRGGADPDIQRGQFNTTDPDLGQNVKTAPPVKSSSVDRSKLYTGDDSWLSNATAPATLPSSFGGDRGQKTASSSDPMRHYGEPGVLPQKETPKFDVMSATKNLLDQMNKRGAQNTSPSGQADNTSSSSTSKRTPAENAAQVEADSEARATRGMHPGGRIESEDEESARLARQQADRESNAARVKADMRARATRGMNYGNNNTSSARGMQQQTPAPEEHSLMGDLGNAFYNAGRALFNLPKDVSKSIGRRI